MKTIFQDAKKRTVHELHLLGRFGASQKVTKIGRNVYPLLDAVSLNQEGSLNAMEEGSFYKPISMISCDPTCGGILFQHNVRHEMHRLGA